jgi:outer membrane receptor for monomeric catechols
VGLRADDRPGTRHAHQGHRGVFASEESATLNAEADSQAVYLFDTVHFGEHFQADLALRYERVKIDYETVSATGVVANFGRTDRATTGRAGLVTNR